MHNQARLLMECKNKQIVHFRFKKLEKKANVKNDDFWSDLLVIMTLLNYHGHMVDILKFLQGMNERLLKVSAL